MLPQAPFTPQVRENTLPTSGNCLGWEREDPSRFRVLLWVSSDSFVLTVWHQNKAEGREMAFLLQGGRARERWDTQVFGACTTSEIGGQKIEGDLIPWGIGGQRLPFLTKG